MSYTAATETPLVLFEFDGDDYTYRKRMFDALLRGQLPDFWRSIGGSDGRRFSALWRPEHAAAVRSWCEANDIRISGALL